MGVEIERKFLVTGEGWREHPGVDFRQGYLSEGVPTVRVRTMGDRAVLTVKGPTQGLSRAEFEYDIPVEDALSMLGTLCGGTVIEKVRRKIEVAGRTWEVDEFGGANAGLVIAEVELSAEDDDVVLPEWVGDEVSSDPRYFNSNLAMHPFTTWS